MRNGTRGFALVAAAVVVGAGCTGGAGAVCGEGTTEVDGTCVADEIEQVACAEGTTKEGSRCVADAGCGPGTELVDGECVPSEDVACGPNTELVDGACVPVDTLAECGEGTILQDNRCVPEQELLVCGPGTVALGGECVAAPEDVTALRITQLRVDNHNAADPATLSASYPVTVTLGVEIEGEQEQPAELQALVALVDEDAGVSCTLGSFFLTQLKNGAEAVYSREAFVDAACVRTSDEDATPVSRTMSPVVLLDPTGVVTFPDRTLEEPVVFSVANEGGAHTTDCVPDAADPDASCNVDFTVQPSPGVDVEVHPAVLASPVVVIPTCDRDAEIAAGIPDAYACNGSIVQREDGGFMYGPPDIPVEYAVRALGVAPAEFSIDDDGEVMRSEVNLLADSEMEISFHFRPADLSGLSETAWQPLYLHSEGDPAKADDEVVQASIDQRFFETSLTPLETRGYKHGLYFENDCGENNTATCDPTVNPRDLVLTGDWSGVTAFELRICALPPDGFETGSGLTDDVASNNCWTGPFYLTQQDVTGSTNPDEVVGVEPDEASWGTGIHYAFDRGHPNTVRVNAAVDGNLHFSLSGLSASTQGRVWTDSKYLPSVEVVKGWANGGVFTTFVGTYYDYGLKVFGHKLFGETRTAELALAFTPVSFARDVSVEKTFWEFVVPITIWGGITGTLGLDIRLDVTGKCNPSAVSCGSQRQLSVWEQGQFPPAAGGSPYEHVGVFSLEAKPYGVATAHLGTGVNLALVRAGIEGQLDLVNVGFPFQVGLRFGTANNGTFRYVTNSFASMNVKVLDGRVLLVVDNFVPTGLFSWGWQRWTSYQLFSWSGWAYNIPFFAVSRAAHLN